MIELWQVLLIGCGACAIGFGAGTVATVDILGTQRHLVVPAFVLAGIGLAAFLVGLVTVAP